MSKKTKKILSTIALAIISILYSTSIFGANGTTLSQVINSVPEDIYDLIDEFWGNNDGVFRETGYIKPYSRSLDSIRDCLPAIFFALCAAVLSRTLPKIASKIGFMFSFLYASVLIVETGWMASVTYGFPLFVKNYRDEESPERLFITNHQSDFFPKSDKKEYIGIKKNFFLSDGTFVMSEEHCRPLSDIRLKNRATSNHMLQENQSLFHQDLGNNKPSVFFRLEDGKINAYLSDDCQKSENKLHSLPTTERVN